MGNNANTLGAFNGRPSGNEYDFGGVLVICERIEALASSPTILSASAKVMLSICAIKANQIGYQYTSIT
jgi:hypothetical protein